MVISVLFPAEKRRLISAAFGKTRGFAFRAKRFLGIPPLSAGIVSFEHELFRMPTAERR
jgi:hypothetical protein